MKYLATITLFGILLLVFQSTGKNPVYLARTNPLTDTIFYDAGDVYQHGFHNANLDIENPFPYPLTIDTIVLVNPKQKSPFKWYKYRSTKVKIEPKSNLTVKFSAYRNGTKIPGKYAHIWKVKFVNNTFEKIVSLKINIKNNTSVLSCPGITIPPANPGDTVRFAAIIRNTGNYPLQLTGFANPDLEQFKKLTMEASFPITIPRNGQKQIWFTRTTADTNCRYFGTLGFNTNEDIEKPILNVSYSGQLKLKNTPYITFDSIVKTKYVNQNGDGRFTFWFTNTGDVPLIISMVKTSCGCLVASCSREPIPPGEGRSLIARYDTKRIGPINKSITITSNACQSRMVLRVRGYVEPKPVQDDKNPYGNY